VLTGLKKAGLVAGDKVCFQMPDIQDAILVTWACWLASMVIVPLPIPEAYNMASAKLQKLEAACQMCDDKVTIVTNSASVASIQNLSTNFLSEHKFPDRMTVLSVSDLRNNEPDADEHKASPQDYAALMLTSGSTGNSKAVILSHANCVQSHYDKAIPCSFDQSIRVLNWIAADHVASICDGNCLPMVLGGTQVHLASQHVVQDPLNFLRVISRYRINQTFAPNFLFGMIVEKLSGKNLQLEEKFDLSCLEVVMSGGEAVVVETAKTCIALLKQHYGLHDHVITPGFGMTEICAGSIFNRGFPTDIDNQRQFACLGTPMPGLHMRVVTDDGKVVPEGQVGNLQFKGVACFRGYYRNPEATLAAFPNGLDDWFNTGDLATITNGTLALAGRTKDTIIINGQNFHSHEIEKEINALEGVDSTHTAATPIRLERMDTEELAVFYHSERALTDEGILYKMYMRIRDTCVKFCGVRPYAIICLPQNLIPKTTLGKIERRKLRAYFENGDFKDRTAHLMNVIKRNAGALALPETKSETDILQLWSDVLGLAPSEISCRINFFDLGGTSLDTIALKAKLDDLFGWDIPAVWVFSYPTVKEIAKKIDDKNLIRHQLKNADGTYNHSLANSLYDPIVRFHDSGDKEPMFAVHTGAGDVLAYVELAKRFQNERPFYGIRTRGFDEGETLFEDFYGMVSEYVEGTSLLHS
jgi:acyl-CoA synthetase (AMP-forming)/AMP-acid ligase II/acyl carrier protein